LEDGENIEDDGKEDGFDVADTVGKALALVKQVCVYTSLCAC
jgi:hypothetical protein